MSEVHFAIVSRSSGSRYDLRARRIGDRFIFDCTCPAGQSGQHCKHRVELLDGVISDLVSGNEQDVARLRQLAAGTSVERHLKEVATLETEFENLKRRLTAAKKALGREMCS